MAEEATLKWSELKKLFQETDQKELINLLHDLYKNSVENRRFITARYAKAGDENKILEAYRKKVINVYYPPRGAASRPRYSVAKKAINEYFEASGDIKGTMDLTLTLVENIMKYLHEFSGIDEASQVGGSDMMEKFCELGRTEKGQEFYPYFRERLHKLYRDSDDSPYGIGDNLQYYISNLVDDIADPEDDFFEEDLQDN
ncbi:hypothetical protein MSSIH_2216 [Methanosarcina siciliae HI350]|uniref:Uncharacterized protein n=1 Tax=Methanosarcina siciliae HI350 TaxID=1434119 RepID=A0A0E3LB00_9EURY|nr:hypothetical protein [Methanosarcina siciliae]AKB32906.1 hypothetical protein MSSIH_2216 [Methanosarcina siciliae HI350]